MLNHLQREVRPPGTRSHSPLVATRGCPSTALLDDDVRKALRLLDDPIALEELSLARLWSVRKLASRYYPGRTGAEGLALRRLLQQILRDIAADLEGSPIGALATGLLGGRTQAGIAREIGLSEEYLCRKWKPALIRLVREAATAQVLTERSRIAS